MPVIVVGADTALGTEIIGAFAERAGEVRAFVTDVSVGLALKDAGVKVAIGDVSDASHVGGAATRCFSAVLVPEAAFDDRERSFADDGRSVLRGWREALRDAGVTRAIAIADRRVPDLPDLISGAAPEIALVPSGTSDEVTAEVVRLDDLASL